MAIMGGNTRDHLVVIFGLLGDFISFLVFLAPVPTFYRIFKRKSTEDFHSLPYLVALFSSMLWLYYASVKGNSLPLVTINIFGCVIESIYIVIFIIYANRNGKILTVKLFMIMNVGTFVMILLTTHFALHGGTRVTVLGWICVSFAVSVFAAPLSIMAKVIRTKSVEFMPFNLSFFLTISAVVWFLYGLFCQDICIAVPNVVGFTLGLIQMTLYGIYRKGETENKANKMDEEHHHATLEGMINLVVVNPLAGTCEVYPLPIIDHEKDQNVTDSA